MVEIKGIFCDFEQNGEAFFKGEAWVIGIKGPNGEEIYDIDFCESADCDSEALRTAFALIRKYGRRRPKTSKHKISLTLTTTPPASAPLPALPPSETPEGEEKEREEEPPPVDYDQQRRKRYAITRADPDWAKRVKTRCVTKIGDTSTGPLLCNREMLTTSRGMHRDTIHPDIVHASLLDWELVGMPDGLVPVRCRSKECKMLFPTETQEKAHWGGCIYNPIHEDKLEKLTGGTSSPRWSETQGSLSPKGIYGNGTLQGHNAR